MLSQINPFLSRVVFARTYFVILLHMAKLTKSTTRVRSNSVSATETCIVGKLEKY